MKTHTFRMACVGIAGAACITWIAFSAEPPPPPSSGLPTGWHWTGRGTNCNPPPCIGAWDDSDNWSWHSGDPALPPPGPYPQEESDDVYIAWSDASPLVVELSTEGIDSLEVQGDANGSTQSITFESVSTDDALNCDHVAFIAIDGTLTITVTDGATLQTPY